MIYENNEQFEQYGLDFSKLTPCVPFAGITDPVEQDAAMQSAAIAYIKARPLAWLRGDLDRVTRFFTPSDLNFSRFQKLFSALS
jgi:hypothetical protein